VRYIHADPSPDDPEKLRWMDGDPVQAIWRIAREIDAKIMAAGKAQPAKRKGTSKRERPGGQAPDAR
jgi:hypothetical protein